MKPPGAVYLIHFNRATNTRAIISVCPNISTNASRTICAGWVHG